jgi:DNA-binding response OmpR family regulator
MQQPIIVIEDDPTLLSLLRDALTDEGYAVLLWAQAVGAYEFIRDRQPALVILDLRLERPESGWELLTLLRMSPHTAALPILVCSADSATLQARADELQALQVAVLAKPFTIDALLTVIQRLIQDRPE